MTCASDRPAPLLVLNPAAGGTRRGRILADVLDAFAGFGVHPTPAPTRHAGHATELVREYVDGGGRDVLVIGGDGTINEVADGLVDPRGPRADRLVLGVVHAGTGGDLARTLGLPRSLRDGIAIAACGRARPVDVGMATMGQRAGHGTVERAFLNVASVGLSAEVVRHAAGPLRRAGSTGSFALATVRSLAGLQPYSIRIDAGDGWVAAQVTDAMVCNGRYVGGGMLAAPLAEPDDGVLDLLLVGAAPRRTILGKFGKIYRGTHVEDPLVRYARAATVRIDAPEPLDVVLDGELAGTTQLTTRVLPAAIRVRCAD